MEIFSLSIVYLEFETFNDPCSNSIAENLFVLLE